MVSRFAPSKLHLKLSSQRTLISFHLPWGQLYKSAGYTLWVSFTERSPQSNHCTQKGLPISAVWFASRHVCTHACIHGHGCNYGCVNKWDAWRTSNIPGARHTSHAHLVEQNPCKSQHIQHRGYKSNSLVVRQLAFPLIITRQSVAHCRKIPVGCFPHHCNTQPHPPSGCNPWFVVNKIPCHGQHNI